MSLGRNLKELRQQQSLNQKDLSDRSRRLPSHHLPH